MRGKGTRARVIFGVILVLLFIGIQYLSGNPYFSWYFNALYQVESAKIESTLSEAGEMEVHETIHYRMRKPFRGVFREIPPSRYAIMKDVTIWTEGLNTQDVEFSSLPQGGFSARVWLVPRGSTTRLDPRTHPRVTLHVTYRVRNVVESGVDVTQIFRQFWGDWDAPVGLLEGVFDFPDHVRVHHVYTHPKMFSQKTGNRYLFQIFRLPPRSIAEARFILEPLPSMLYAVENPTLSLEEVQRVETAYQKEIRNQVFLWTGVLGFFVMLFLIIYLILGREVPVDYQRFYEQEPPYPDPPDLVNAVVRHFASQVGDEGVAAALLNLYHQGAITFEEEGKRPLIRLLGKPPSHELSPSEMKLLTLLQQFATSNTFSFDTLRERLENSVSEARSFNTLFQAYKNEVLKELRRRRYLQNTGNVLAKVLAVLMMLVSLAVLPTQKPETAHLLSLWTILAGTFFFGSGVILMVRKDAFGRWNKEGRMYFLRWQSFARFLSDYSLLSERPPQSVIIWEKYLIYATALGIAQEVMKNLEKLVPREVFERESPHPFFYHPGTYLFGSELHRLHVTAISTITQSQARSYSKGGFGSGGFSGGAGGFGGGSGGGRGGAF
ncbi:MAG: DUF2207 domain-containing protein [Atribacterota bacterium]